MKKLLFVSTYTNPSVLRDFKILKKHFDSKYLYFPNIKKTPVDLLKTFFSLIINVYRVDVCFVRFADFRAYLVILFSKLFHRKTAVAIGGYEVAKELQYNYGALLNKGGEKRIKYILENADIIIANSEFSKNEIIRLVPDKNVHKIYHGIDKIAEFPNKEDLIVTIGNSYEYKHLLKGIDTFVRAAKKLSIRAVVIGDYEKSIYEKLRTIYPEIEMTGYLSQKEIQEILKRAKVYCQLSYRESFGVALLEAMSAGCVPVVTNKAALPEVVGDVGFYTEFGDATKTADAIKKALNSDQSNAVINRVNEMFTLKKREERLIKLLKDNSWI